MVAEISAVAPLKIQPRQRDLLIPQRDNRIDRHRST
jgi:hypothetical protein